MQIYLPIAGMPVDVLALIVLGLVTGAISGLFGVGGGFLLTPFLLFMGIPPAIAVGSQTAQLIGSSISGVMTYWKKRAVDIHMSLVLFAGSAVGIFFGLIFFNHLKKIGQIDFAIAASYIFVLGSLSFVMLFESIQTLIREKSAIPLPLTKAPRWVRRLPFQVLFPHSSIRASLLMPLGIGFIAGLLVVIMGIGGGFVIVPALNYLLRMPPHFIPGTSLLQIVFATFLVTILQATINHTVDFVLAFYLILGSALGVQIGARYGYDLRGPLARLFLSLLVLSVSLRLVLELTHIPQSLYSLERKGEK